MDSWMFASTLYYNPMLCYLSYCSNCPHFGHSELFQSDSYVPLICPILLIFFKQLHWSILALQWCVSILLIFKACPYFLALQDTLGSSCIFPCPSPRTGDKRIIKRTHTTNS